MLSNVEEKGNLLFGMENSNTFLKSARALANTIATMPDIEIISAYKSFLRNLEVYGFQGTEENLITSINVIKTRLDIVPLLVFCRKGTEGRISLAFPFGKLSE